MLKLLRWIFCREDGLTARPDTADLRVLKRLPPAPEGQRYCWSDEKGWFLVDIPAGAALVERPHGIASIGPKFNEKDLRKSLRKLSRQMKAMDAAKLKRRAKRKNNKKNKKA